MDYGRFGSISIERGDGEPRDAVLFLSGDGGWNLGVVSMARRLADKGAVVAGIDIRHYLAQLEKSSEKCVSPAADFENLSRYLQAKLGSEALPSAHPGGLFLGRNPGVRDARGGA